MVHLLPLVGSPRYEGNMEAVIDRACDDAEILTRNGVDGIVVENYGDLPFYPDRVPSETIAAMTRVATEVRHITDLPLGINVLRNDAISALSIAEAVDAQFIRVNVFTGAALSEQGLLFGRAHDILRHRSSLKSDVLILADIAVKHAHQLIDYSIEDMVRETVERGLADGIIVSGKATGEPVDVKFANTVHRLTQRLDVPMLVGSGVDVHNIQTIWPVSDGIIIGTAIKKDHITTNPVDEKKLRLLLEQIKRIEGR